MVFQKKKEIESPRNLPYWTDHREEIKPLGENPFTGQKSAWKDEKWDRKPERFFRIGNDGAPAELINPEAYLNDAAAFWSMHEQKVIAIIVVCSLYLLFIIF